MRLFLAIELPHDLRSTLSSLSKRLQRDPDLPRCSWVRAENLHITLKFLGEVPDTQVPMICDALISLDVAGETRLTASRLELLPPRGPVRVIAAGLEGDRAILDEVHHQIETRMHPIGFPPEARRFRPHITLARARRPLAPAVRRRLEELPLGLRQAAQFTVSEIVLMESRLQPDAAQYIPLARFPISPGAAP